jgi:flavin reductase (DIM6/NTAB) family NADH-FMN oxidoreductase RutF
MNNIIENDLSASSISLDEYRALFRNHPGGVAVITMSDGQKSAGFTATSVISVSGVPPLLLFSINKTTSSWPVAEVAPSAVVHFLSKDDRHIADRFATSGIDRFADLDFTTLPTGEALIAGVETWAQGEIVSRVDLGSSVLFVLHIEQSSAADTHDPLVYGARNYYHLNEGNQLS